VTPYTLADIFPSSEPLPGCSEISVHIRHDNPDETSLHIHGRSVSNHTPLLAGFEGKIQLVFRYKVNARMSVLMAVLSNLPQFSRYESHKVIDPNSHVSA
jgi:hypothetical protein